MPKTVCPKAQAQYKTKDDETVSVGSQEFAEEMLVMIKRLLCSDGPESHNLLSEVGRSLVI